MTPQTSNPTLDEPKCDCNICRLPDSWKRALDKYASVWGSGKEANDMGLEFGVPTLIEFVKAIKDEPIPDIKLKKKPLLKQLRKTAKDIAKGKL
jgi:hypothetical protein